MGTIAASMGMMRPFTQASSGIVCSRFDSHYLRFRGSTRPHTFRAARKLCYILQISAEKTSFQTDSLKLQLLNVRDVSALV
jgi:hypothetical protein